MKQEFRRGMAAARKYLGTAPASFSFQRSALGPGMLLYHDPLTDVEAKTLIIGFTGNRMRLLMPAYRVLCALDPTSYDLLLMLDHNKRMFRDGMDQIADSLPALADHLRDLGAARGYKRVVGLGTSAGSLAVLQAGIHAGLDVAVSVAPASLAKHHIWRADFEAFADQHDPQTTKLRVVYGRRPRHQAAADEIIARLPNCEGIRYRHASKNILAQAQDRGELAHCLQQWLSR
jgi:hypothetical protein